MDRRGTRISNRWQVHKKVASSCDASTKASRRWPPSGKTCQCSRRKRQLPWTHMARELLIDNNTQEGVNDDPSYPPSSSLVFIKRLSTKGDAQVSVSHLLFPSLFLLLPSPLREWSFVSILHHCIFHLSYFLLSYYTLLRCIMLLHNGFEFILVESCLNGLFFSIDMHIFCSIWMKWWWDDLLLIWYTHSEMILVNDPFV